MNGTTYGSLKGPELNTAVCVFDLLVIALGILDTCKVPGEIGAHLDHSIQLLDKFLGSASPSFAATLIN